MTQRLYFKTGMDRLTKEQRSWTMSRIRSSKTGFEKKIFSELRKRVVYFKTHYSGVIGKPDIAVPSRKKVVFLHSDFWHGWQFPRWKSILPNNFWKNKINQNRKRDMKVKRVLRRAGWNVLVIWEHQIKKDFDSAIGKLVRFLKR